MDKNINDIWQKTLQNLKTQLSDVSFDTWIRVIQPLTIKDNEIVLSVPNEFTKNILQSRYIDTISGSLKEVIGSPVFINFILENEVDSFLETMSPKDMDNNHIHSVLNPKYTCDTFVVGNTTICSCSLSAVAEAPAKPITLIHNGGRTGQTHLMHAIGHFIWTIILMLKYFMLHQKNLLTN